jgi:hypothetical protein
LLCRWVSSLEEEFFLQGDRERQMGVPLSPLCDRTKQGVTKSQVGYVTYWQGLYQLMLWLSNHPSMCCRRALPFSTLAS